MLFLPTEIVALLSPFAPLFSRPVWRHVQVLLVGAILAPGRRMVTCALRAVWPKANLQKVECRSTTNPRETGRRPLSREVVRGGQQQQNSWHAESHMATISVGEQALPPDRHDPISRTLDKISQMPYACRMSSAR